jgi:hypothetical protein
MTAKTVAAQRTAADALEDAQAQLAGLTRASISANNRQRELARVRQELAFAGLTDGTPADQKRLIEATEEAGRVELEIQNLQFAMVEAKRRVAAAEAEFGREGVRLRAEEAQAKIAEWRLHGSRAAALLMEFLQEYDLTIGDSKEIRRLVQGLIRFPGAEQLEVSIRSALQVHLYRRHLQTEPLLVALSSRHELGAVLEKWTEQAESALDRVIEGGVVPAPVAVDYGRPPPLPMIEGEQYLDNEEAAQ